MKKFFALLAIAFLSVNTFAQEGSKVALFQEAKQLEKSKETGNYQFFLDSKAYTKESVMDVAKHYTKYFTVEVTSDDTDLKVSLDYVDGNEWSSKVFKRFLISLQVSAVSLDGQEMEIEPFFERYVL